MWRALSKAQQREYLPQQINTTQCTGEHGAQTAHTQTDPAMGPDINNGVCTPVDVTESWSDVVTKMCSAYSKVEAPFYSCIYSYIYFHIHSFRHAYM